MNSRYTIDLLEMAESGAELVIDAQSKSTEELVQLADVVQRNGGKLILRNINGKLTGELLQICSKGKDHVSLDFT